MICAAAGALEDGRTVAVGTGLPCAAAMLAQKTHAPNLVIVFEAGGLAPQLPTMPISVDSEGDRAKAISELQRLSGGTLPFLQDMTRGVLFDTQAAGMPVTIIYNRQGQEIARLAGGADWGSEDASRLIEAVLDRKSVV